MNEKSKLNFGCLFESLLVGIVFFILIDVLALSCFPTTIKQSIIDNAVQSTDISKYKSYLVIPTNNDQNMGESKPMAVVVASNATGKSFNNIKSQVMNQLIAYINTFDHSSIILKNGSNYKLYTVSYESQVGAIKQPKSCSVKQVSVVIDSMDDDDVSGLGQSVNKLKKVNSMHDLENWIGTRIKQLCDHKG